MSNDNIFETNSTYKPRQKWWPQFAGGCVHALDTIIVLVERTGLGRQCYKGWISKTLTVGTTVHCVDRLKCRTLLLEHNHALCTHVPPCKHREHRDIESSAKFSRQGIRNDERSDGPSTTRVSISFL